jgi:hypothetical protein
MIKGKTTEKVFSVISVIIVVGVVVGGGIFGVSMYDRMFPIAPDIAIPSDEEIFEIAISENGGDKIFLNDGAEDEILAFMRSCQPTRNWTVNDYPYAEEYYVINVYTSEEGDGYRYFVYKENGHVYLELPYHGVYTVDEGILDLISGYTL